MNCVLKHSTGVSICVVYTKIYTVFLCALLHYSNYWMLSLFQSIFRRKQVKSEIFFFVLFFVCILLKIYESFSSSICVCTLLLFHTFLCVYFYSIFFQIKEKHVNEKHVLLIKNDIAEMIKLITE